MKKLVLVSIVAALGCLGLATAHAEPAAAEASGCQGPPLEAVFGPSTLTLAAMAPSEEDKPGGTPEASCVADCETRPEAVCWGTTCWAVDQNCPGTQGYCYGSSTGYRYCNACEPTVVCSAYADCSGAGGGSVSCDSYGANDCYAIDDCYAYCDGTYHMCPSPPGPCPY